MSIVGKMSENKKVGEKKPTWRLQDDSNERIKNYINI